LDRRGSVAVAPGGRAALRAPTDMDAENSLSLEQWGLETLFNITQLAEYLRVAVSTIYEWRAKVRAAPAHHSGKHLT
ncbi:MAG: hypothetical protein K0R33_4559, partial [Mycobacterium sp.]|nr:hypothetical protein [Mycobacterium sp.]